MADRLSRIARFTNAPEKSLFVFGKQNFFRQALLRLLLDPAFDSLITLVILLNTAFLCVYDPTDRDHKSVRE